MSSFSNATLRNFVNPYVKQAKESYVKAVVSGIKKQVLEKAYADSKYEEDIQKNPSYLNHPKNQGLYKLKIDLPYRDIYGMTRQEYSLLNNILPTFKLNMLIPNIITGLLVEFPEMNIQVDPLETYMLLDWSK